jgi:dTDP-glucose pyrophosphorylase
MTTKVSKAVVLAAGRGTRMKELTEDCPKPMLPVGDKPMLAHVIERLEEAGIDDVLLIVGYKAEKVHEYFDAHPPVRARLSYCLQESPDGTGSAALLGKSFIADERFLLTFGDILVDARTYRSMLARAEGADAVLAVKEVDDPYRGAAVYVDGDRITRIVEKPPQGTSTTRWINAGIYCFGSGVFDELERIPQSPRGEYELTDAIHQMLNSGAYLRWHPIEGYWRDVGRPDDLTLAHKHVEDSS